jgi:hypothetical protein
VFSFNLGAMVGMCLLNSLAVGDNSKLIGIRIHAANLRKVPYPEITMTNDDLGQTLDSLQKSLADSPQIDAPTAEKVRLLIGDIQLALARSEKAADSAMSYGNLTQQVKTMIADFEVNHPKLTASLSFIAERLADMGI